MSGTKLAAFVAATVLVGQAAWAEDKAPIHITGNGDHVVIVGAGEGEQAEGLTFTLGGMGDADESEFIETLTDLNMTPDFSLTADEKKAIKAARDAHKAATAEWEKKNADELKKLQEQQQKAFQANDQGAIETASKAIETLRKTAPSTESLDEKVKAALTEEHRKAVDEKIAAKAAENKGVIRLQLNGNVRPMPAPAPALPDKDDK